MRGVPNWLIALFPASQERIRAIKANLQSCKNLLHCKRDELRKLWIEGIEHKTVAAMLDQMSVLSIA